MPVSREHAAPRPQNVVNLMDALRRSIAQEKAASAPPKKGRKRIAGTGRDAASHCGQEGQGSGGKAGGTTERSSEKGRLIFCSDFTRDSAVSIGVVSWSGAVWSGVAGESLGEKFAGTIPDPSRIDRSRAG